DQLSTDALAGKREFHKDFRVIWPDGSVHWLSDRAQIISDAHGKPVHFMGATVDITQLKQVAKRLQEANKCVTHILESISDVFLYVDTEWRYVYLNRKAEEMMGKSREELLGQKLWDLVPGILGTSFERTYREALATQQTMHIDDFHPIFQRWLDIRVYPTPEGLSIYAQDITERKQAEEALRQSRDAFRLLIEAMPQMVWTSRPDGYQEYVNQQWCDYTGSTLEQTRGEGWVSYYHPDDQQRTLALWYASLFTGQPFDIEARIRQAKTGEYRWFLVRAVPLMNADGEVWKWFGTCTDMHEKKFTEEVLHESDARFRRLAESNIIGIAVVDLKGTIREANEAFLALVDYTQEDLVAERIQWSELTPPEYQEQSAQASREMLATGTYPPFEKEFMTKDGERVPVLVGGAFFRHKNIAQWEIAFVLDLTAHKEMERQKNLMLGMTGHELKTQLAALKG
ncbi:MAG: PAS domain-containing protein, partial [Ktedonobacteraceae bacterium]